MYNEKFFNSATITFIIKYQLNIQIFKAPPYKSYVNGQIEKLYSTLFEIMRRLKKKQIYKTFEKLLNRAMYKCNYTIYPLTRKRP